MIASKADLQLTKVKCAGGDQGAKVMLVSTDGSPNAPARRIAEVVAAEARTGAAHEGGASVEPDATTQDTAPGAR
jgi:hypothetical protein